MMRREKNGITLECHLYRQEELLLVVATTWPWRIQIIMMHMKILTVSIYDLYNNLLSKRSPCGYMYIAFFLNSE